MKAEELLAIAAGIEAEGGPPLELSEEDLSHETIVGTETSLKLVDFGTCNLKNTVFVDCDLRGCDLRRASVRKTRVVRCLTQGADFPSEGVTFHHCTRYTTTKSAEGRNSQNGPMGRIDRWVHTASTLDVSKVYAFTTLFTVLTLFVLALAILFYVQSSV